MHLAGVYLGTLGCAVAAVAGAMYLFVERQLKAKRNPRGLLRLASLERLERLIVQSATLGFALLTLGLVSGVVILWDRHDLAGWWASPKVLLATAAWAVYALVMNVRIATMFRGRRAAWLAIGGLVLLLGVYGIVTAGNDDANPESPSHVGRAYLPATSQYALVAGRYARPTSDQYVHLQRVDHMEFQLQGVLRQDIQRQNAKTPRRQERQVGQDRDKITLTGISEILRHESQVLLSTKITNHSVHNSTDLVDSSSWRLGGLAAWRLSVVYAPGRTT